MDLNDLKPAPGSVHARKRVGRGSGSGHGSKSGRGDKGQKARAGGGVRPGFEGGQLPIVKRMPYRRGFVNLFRIEYAAVNLSRLEAFQSGAEIDGTALANAGIIDDPWQPVKVLGDGDLDRPLVIKANKFSASAKAKIEAAGGQAIEIGAPTEVGEKVQE
jgi:large subunit ribosomal protein L15